jgi:hypothetical protein
VKTQWIVYLWSFSVFIYAKMVGSYSTYTDVANLHNHIDEIPVTTSTPDFEEDPVAEYLGYYD